MPHGFLDSPLLCPPAPEVCKSGLGSPWKFHKQRRGGSCLPDYPWQQLPVTHWARESWCQPPQTNAKYIAVRGKKRKERRGRRKAEYRRALRQNRTGWQRQKRKNRKKQGMLEIISYRLRKKKCSGRLYWERTSTNCTTQMSVLKGKSQNAVVLQNKLLHWDLKSAIVAQQRPLPAESWQVCA